jgi:hypothetical protein
MSKPPRTLTFEPGGELVTNCAYGSKISEQLGGLTARLEAVHDIVKEIKLGERLQDKKIDDLEQKVNTIVVRLSMMAFFAAPIGLKLFEWIWGRVQ